MTDYFVNSSHNTYLEGKLERGFPTGPGFLTYKDKKYSGLYLLNEKRCLFIGDNGKVLRNDIGNSKRLNEAIVQQFKTGVKRFCGLFKGWKESFWKSGCYHYWYLFERND